MPFLHPSTRRCLPIVLGALLQAFPTLAGPGAAAGPVHLQQAVNEALAHGPTLQAPEDRVQRAEIDQRLVRSRFDLRIEPRLSTDAASSGYSRSAVGLAVSRQLTTGTQLRFTANSIGYGPGLGNSRDTGYSVEISQPLLHAFTPTVRAPLTDAARAVSGSARMLRDARQQLAITVAQAYFGVVRARRLAEAADRALQRARRLSTASEARTRVGLATRLDVFRAQLLVSRSAAAVADRRAALDDARDRLKLLMGRPVNEPIAVSEDDLALYTSADRSAAPTDPASAGEPPPGTGSVATPAVVGSDPLAAAALSNRLDLREEQDRVRDAERAETVARWNLLPQVNLTVGYTRRGIGSPLGDALNHLVGGWRFGVTTSYALTRAEQTSAVAKAAIDVEAAHRALDVLRQQVTSQVRRARRDRDRARATVTIQRSAVSLADEQLQLAQLRYQRGLASSLDVVDAEGNLFESESALVSAQVDEALAELMLRRVTGTLDPERLQP